MNPVCVNIYSQLLQLVFMYSKRQQKLLKLNVFCWDSETCQYLVEEFLPAYSNESMTCFCLNLKSRFILLLEHIHNNQEMCKQIFLPNPFYIYWFAYLICWIYLNINNHFILQFWIIYKCYKLNKLLNVILHICIV